MPQRLSQALSLHSWSENSCKTQISFGKSIYLACKHQSHD